MDVIDFLIVVGILAFMYQVFKGYRDDNVPTKKKNYPYSIFSKVVGVSFDNDDGSSRQKNIIKYIKEDDELFLKGYKYNGKAAIAVYAKENQPSTQIGNISSDLTIDILELSPSTDIELRVKNVTGGTQGKEYYGVNIEIFTTEKL